MNISYVHQHDPDLYTAYRCNACCTTQDVDKVEGEMWCPDCFNTYDELRERMSDQEAHELLLIALHGRTS